MLNYCLLTQTLLTYKIKSENVYDEFFKWKDLFDFSNYSEDSKFFDNANKKVIGKMKDEFGGAIIDEFIGLKSKMMNLKMFYLIKKLLDIKSKEFKLRKHKIGTYKIDKISLSFFDDKRYVSDDGIHTLAYFHKDSNNLKKIVIAEISDNGKLFMIIKKRL